MEPRNPRTVLSTWRQAHSYVLAFVCVVAGCSKKPTGTDDAFSKKWAELSGLEVLYVEAEGGQGLMGRVPRNEHLPDKTGLAEEYSDRTGADLHPTRPPVPVAPSLAGAGGTPGVALGEQPTKAGTLPEALSHSEVSSVVRRNLGGVRVCYLKLARNGGSASGRAIVSFSVAPEGKVGQVRVESPVFQDTSLPNCVSEQVKRWSFPQTQKGGANVQYPLVFVGG